MLGRQLDGSLPEGATGANLVVAYEPVWAIGTGLTPTAADVGEAHGFVRERLAQRLWRGRPRRCASSTAARSSRRTPQELMAVADVDGALVGGASLKADDFLGIAGAYRDAVVSRGVGRRGRGGNAAGIV